MSPRPGARVDAVIVVPTRNRAELAELAVRSVVEQAGDDVGVVVSDNSTSEEEAARLADFCAGQGELVTYLRPSAPLPMTAHWEWALLAARASSDASHVGFLTDRMRFKPEELPSLLETASRFPAKAVTYNIDTVLDHVRPIRLRLEPWSGQLFQVASQHLLYLSSRGVTSPSLPRMLNSLVPREVVADVEARFGSVFGSVSPDFCFAYRCLDTVDSLVYVDKAPLLQYGLSRSHGLSYATGVESPDRQDFKAQLGEAGMNFASPVPEFETIRNAILHEYAFVKGESQSGKFPEIDPRGYIAAIVEDLSLVEDREARSRALAVLADTGWVGSPKRRYDAAMAVVKLMFVGWDVFRGVQRLLGRFAPWIPRFDSQAAAIEYAIRHPRPPEQGLAHVEALFRPAGFTQVIDASTTQPSRLARVRE